MIVQLTRVTLVMMVAIVAIVGMLLTAAGTRDLPTVTTSTQIGEAALLFPQVSGRHQNMRSLHRFVFFFFFFFGPLLWLYLNTTHYAV